MQTTTVTPATTAAATATSAINSASKASKIATHLSVKEILANLPQIKARQIPVSKIFGNTYDEFPLLQFVDTLPGVPEEPRYIPDIDVFTIFLRWFSSKPVNPIALEGPTGSGKTEMPAYMCSKLNIPMYKLQCHEELRADTLFVQKDIVVEDGASKTVELPTALLKAYAQGGLIVLDEFDKLEGPCTAALHALTEYKPISIGGDVIKPHRFTKVMGTSNTVGCGVSVDYTSSKQLDMAFRSRFDWLNLNYPSKEVEVSILAHHYPKMDFELHKMMIEVADVIRIAKREGSLTLPFSPRNTVGWGHNIQMLGVKAKFIDSFNFSYVNGLEEDERQSAIDAFAAVLGDKADKTIEEIVNFP